MAQEPARRGWTVVLSTVAGAVCAWPAASSAQRRDSEPVATVLTAHFSSHVKFGSVVVAPREYRVTLASGGLVLTDPQSWVVVATLPVVESIEDGAVDPATVTLSEQGQTVTLVLRHLEHSYTATGERADAAATAAPAVVLAKHETALSASLPVERSEAELVQQALKRYSKEVVHCAEKAVRSAWGTDDEHYYKCVCPLAAKWRLPKVKQPLRAHYVLVKERAGMSLTAQPDGKSTDCRVWVGKEPPAPPAEPSPVAPAAAGPGATP